MIQQHLGQLMIPQVSEVKYLGVYYNNHFIWRLHITRTVRRVAQDLGALRRFSQRTVMHHSALLLLYKDYVRSA